MAPVRIPLFLPNATWAAPRVSDLPSWKGAFRVAIDIETCDPALRKTGIGVRRKGYVVGVSFAIQEREEDDPARSRGYYLPFAHEGGDNLAREHVLAYLKDQARDFRGQIVGANLSYDLDYLAHLGIVFQPTFFRDVQIAEPLLDENQFSYSLQAIADRNGFPGKDESKLEEAAKAFGVDPKGGMWQLPARFVGEYAERDATLPLELIARQEQRIREQAAMDPHDNGKFWGLYDLESRLLPVLVKMRRRGVRVNLAHLDKVESRCFREEAKSMVDFSSAVGRTIPVEDVNRASVIGPALEDALGIKLPRTEKSGAISVKSEILQQYRGNPAVDALLRAKRYNKLRSTFVESIRSHQVDGRIHCTFRQLRGEAVRGGVAGVGPGRLSSSDPNLQQQPARDPEIGELWRQLYLPDEGGEWACLDYSSQEPRWLIHFAEQKRLPKAREAAERYRKDPKTDNHGMMAQIIHGDDVVNLPPKQFKKLRSDAKTILLGLCYGMGAGKLCRQLGYDTEWIESKSGKMVEVAGKEGERVLDKFRKGLPYVAMLADAVEQVAKKRGYVKTILGRRCRFEVGPSGRPEFTYRALNRLIQGSSADQTKKALVMADDAGYKLQLQVHDELDLTVENHDQARGLAEIMRNAVPANVPFQVDIECGPSWGDIRDIDG